MENLSNRWCKYSLLKRLGIAAGTSVLVLNLQACSGEADVNGSPESNDDTSRNQTEPRQEAPRKRNDSRPETNSPSRQPTDESDQLDRQAVKALQARQERLKQTLLDLPAEARSMAIIGIYCEDDTIGTGLNNADASVQTYSLNLVQNLYERYSDAGPSSLPSDFYDINEQYCPENIPRG